MRHLFLVPVVALALATTACGGPSEGRPGNPPGTEVTRAVDRAAGTNVSGAFPAQSDGTRANPAGTEVSRTFDRAAGTNTSGAYPAQRDGTRANPRGTAASRALNTTNR